MKKGFFLVPETETEEYGLGRAKWVGGWVCGS